MTIGSFKLLAVLAGLLVVCYSLRSEPDGGGARRPLLKEKVPLAEH